MPVSCLFFPTVQQIHSCSEHYGGPAKEVDALSSAMHMLSENLPAGFMRLMHMNAGKADWCWAS